MRIRFLYRRRLTYVSVPVNFQEAPRRFDPTGHGGITNFDPKIYRRPLICRYNPYCRTVRTEKFRFSLPCKLGRPRFLFLPLSFSDNKSWKFFPPRPTRCIGDLFELRPQTLVYSCDNLWTWKSFRSYQNFSIASIVLSVCNPGR